MKMTWRQWMVFSLPAALLGFGCNQQTPAGPEAAAPQAEQAPAAQPEHAADAHADHAGHWAYTGEGAPETWGDLKPEFATCKTGKEQSPIDITGEMPVKGGPIKFAYAPFPLKALNNGHTIQANNSVPNSIEIDGAKFDLLQIHFHAPSEHTIDGKHADMELHMVHKNAEGKLAVVGLMLNKGADNPVVASLWSHIPAEVNKEESVAGVNVDLASILPADQNYYHYMGSLTTPPCSEGVSWYVLKTPGTVSEAELNKFNELLKTNARPTQPLSGRELVRSN